MAGCWCSAERGRSKYLCFIQSMIAWLSFILSLSRQIAVMADRQMDRFQKNIKSCSHLCYPGSEFTDDLPQCPGILMPVNTEVKCYSCNKIQYNQAISASDSMENLSKSVGINYLSHWASHLIAVRSFQKVSFRRFYEIIGNNTEMRINFWDFTVSAKVFIWKNSPINIMMTSARARLNK